MQGKFRYWILIAICGLMLWFGFVIQKPATSSAKDAQILHVINRLSFGPTPGEISRIKSIGTEAYIEAQLSPSSISESPRVTRSLDQLTTIALNPLELYQTHHPPTVLRQNKYQGLPEEKLDQIQKQLGKRRQIVRQQAMEARLVRAIYSPRQLQEVMVDFWFNHFNVHGSKTITDFWLSNYEDAIRANAFGRFRDLLEVTAKNPAMLVYLDNEVNTDPNSKAGKRSSKGLNENYARELMELHTLGVDGGYTQDDIIALAKILTGWSVDRQGKWDSEENGFIFYPQRHDSSDKIFLGHTIKGSGIAEGEQALDILAAHPATAHFISYKLAQYFVADQPPESLVDKLAQTFLNSDGKIKTVLSTLFASKEFNDPQYYGKKFKTPYQYIISLIRAGGIERPDYKRIKGILFQLSMPIYGCPTPDGYKNTQEAWLNPDAMVRRVSWATVIARGNLSQKQPVDAQQLQATLGNNFSPETKEVIKTSPPKLRAALMLGSQEMMYR